LLLVAFLLLNAPNCHLVFASVVQGDAVVAAQQGFRCDASALKLHSLWARR